MRLLIEVARKNRPNNRKPIVTKRYWSLNTVGLLLPMPYRENTDIHAATKKPKVAARTAGPDVFGDGISARIIVTKSAHVDNTAMLMSFTTLT